MGVPCSPGARLKRDTGALNQCRVRCLEKWIDADTSSEPVGRTFCGSLRPCSFYLHYRLLLLRSVRMQKRLDGATLVHCPVAFSHLIERQSQIENLAGIDLAVQHQIDQFRQVATNRSRSTVKMNMRVEQ